MRVTVEVRGGFAGDGVGQLAEPGAGVVEGLREGVPDRDGEPLGGNRDEEGSGGDAGEPRQAEEGQIDRQTAAEERECPVGGSFSRSRCVNPVDRRHERSVAKSRTEAMGLAGEDGVRDRVGAPAVDPVVLELDERVAELGFVDDRRGGNPGEPKEIAQEADVAQMEREVERRIGGRPFGQPPYPSRIPVQGVLSEETE